MENNFIDASGHRDSVSWSDFINKMPSAMDLLANNKKIFQCVSADMNNSNIRVELVHDIFCEIVIRQKSLRESKSKNVLEYMCLFPAYTIVVLLWMALKFYKNNLNVPDIGILEPINIAFLSPFILYFVLPEIVLTSIRGRTSLTLILVGAFASILPFIGVKTFSLDLGIIILSILSLFVCFGAMIISLFQKFRGKNVCNYTDVLYSRPNRFLIFVASVALVVLAWQLFRVPESNDIKIAVFMLPLMVYSIFDNKVLPFSIALILLLGFWGAISDALAYIPIIQLIILWLISESNRCSLFNNNKWILKPLFYLFHIIIFFILLYSIHSLFSLYLSSFIPERGNVAFRKDSYSIERAIWIHDSTKTYYPQQEYVILSPESENTIVDNLPVDRFNYDKGRIILSFHSTKGDDYFKNSLFQLTKDSLTCNFDWTSLAPIIYFYYFPHNGIIERCYGMYTQCLRYCIQYYTGNKLISKDSIYTNIKSWEVQSVEIRDGDIIDYKNVCIHIGQCMILEALRDDDIHFLMDAIEAFAYAVVPEKDYIANKRKVIDIETFYRMAYVYYRYHKNNVWQENYNVNDMSTRTIGDICMNSYYNLKDIYNKTDNELHKNNLYYVLNAYLQIAYVNRIITPKELHNEYNNLDKPTIDVMRLFEEQ